MNILKIFLGNSHYKNPKTQLYFLHTNAVSSKWNASGQSDLSEYDEIEAREGKRIDYYFSFQMVDGLNFTTLSLSSGELYTIFIYAKNRNGEGDLNSISSYTGERDLKKIL